MGPVMVRILSRPPHWVKKLTSMGILCVILSSLSIIIPPALHTPCFRLSPMIHNVNHSLKAYLKTIVSGVSGVITNTSNIKSIIFFPFIEKYSFGRQTFYSKITSSLQNIISNYLIPNFLGFLFVTDTSVVYDETTIYLNFSNFFSFKFKFKDQHLQEYNNLYCHISKYLSLFFNKLKPIRLNGKCIGVSNSSNVN